MRVWTLSSFLAVGVLAVACGSDPPKEEGALEKTAISNLPLSAACSACAQTAMGGSCKGELQACVNNPSCFDVESCLAACNPQDLSCFGQCAQASAVFDDLTSCVFCDSCTKECSGEWDCGGQPPQPTACDNTGDCGACTSCAGQNECAAEVDQCLQSTECAELAQCAIGCGDAPDCVKNCMDQFQNGIPEFEKAAQCVACQACPNDCSAQGQVLGCSNGSSSGGNQCDGTGECTKCAQCAGQGACAPELEACLKVDECAQVVECVQSCGGPDCVNQCVQSFPNTDPVLQDLVTCVACDQCPSDCSGKDLGCPP